jgi:predicted phosphodiesterase
MELRFPLRLTNDIKGNLSMNPEQLQILYKTIGVKETPFVKKARKRNPNKMLVLADIHAPYHNDKMVNDAINSNRDASRLMIVGDGVDLYSASHFRKTKNVDIGQELGMGFEFLKSVAEEFDEVYLMLANHDQRLRKYMYDHVPNELLPFIKLDFLEILLKQIPNLKIVKQKTIGSRKIDFIYKHNDVVFSHAEVSSIILTQPVQKIKPKLDEWDTYMNLDGYKVLIQAHNHQCGMVQVGDKILYQIPCMIDLDQIAFDYVFNGRMAGRMPAFGYMVLNFVNDKVDYNNIRVYHHF